MENLAENTPEPQNLVLPCYFKLTVNPDLIHTVSSIDTKLIGIACFHEVQVFLFMQRILMYISVD